MFDEISVSAGCYPAACDCYISRLFRMWPRCREILPKFKSKQRRFITARIDFWSSPTWLRNVYNFCRELNCQRVCFGVLCGKHAHASLLQPYHWTNIYRPSPVFYRDSMTRQHSCVWVWMHLATCIYRLPDSARVLPRLSLAGVAAVKVTVSKASFVYNAKLTSLLSQNQNQPSPLRDEKPALAVDKSRASMNKQFNPFSDRSEQFALLHRFKTRPSKRTNKKIISTLYTWWNLFAIINALGANGCQIFRADSSLIIARDQPFHVGF